MKKLVCIGMFPLIMLLGCGSGGGGADVPSKVSYSESAGKGTVEKYTNAEWLYQNYFGDYGMPEEFKQSIMPTVKMMANGFALQLRRGDAELGDDVNGSIEYCHKQFLQFVASGEAAQFVKSMSDQKPELPINPDMPRLTIAEQEEQMKNYVPPPMSDDAKKAVAEALAEEERVRAEIKKIAADYKLPYTIEGRDEQWLIYSPTMKSLPHYVPGYVPSTATKQHDIIPWNWRPGDILWSNGSSGLGIPEHVGIVDTYHPTPWAIEANIEAGVVTFLNLNTWANRYTQVRAYSPKLGWSSSEPDNVRVWQPPYLWWPGQWVWKLSDSANRRYAVVFANTQSNMHAPYNYNIFNPQDLSKFYCSSLIWSAYTNFGSWDILGRSVPWGTAVLPSDITSNNYQRVDMFNSSSL